MRKLLFTLFIASIAVCSAQQRNEVTLSEDWLFSRDKLTWQQVSVPHDWAINGPFDKKHDLQTVAIVQDGETEKTEKSGRSGALPWISEGHYKKCVTIPEGFGYVELRFDGAMSEPIVRVNGKEAGRWAYGYNAFRIDATPFVKPGKNLIEVDLHNVEESSRWYPGGGIYRPVKLILTKKTHIDDWGGWFRTVKATENKAIVNVYAKVEEYENESGLVIKAALTDKDGNLVCGQTVAVNKKDGSIEVDLSVNKPQLWSPENPYLYTLTTTLYSNGKCIDRTQKRVGIRTVDISAKHGFRLNGISRKIKGVCLHHDLGPIGAAVNKAAIIRQIRILKDMGCDAIRTSHNMPSTMQMEVCDSMGMMVMAESFDMWIYPKCKNGYSRFFKEWADRDITNLVLNHRDHPSIIMWSIGNEIPEQSSEEGREISKHLQEICHKLDPTRPVTQGIDKPDEALKSGVLQVMDVPGLNYRLHKYDSSFKQLPQGFLLGSETASTVSSRGVYKFPVKVVNRAVYPDGQCSGYDTECCPWSNLPDDDWAIQEDRKWTIGEFVWTGFDYLGEPTPYNEYWPSRSSYFGICDLAGLPKDRYWLYRSHWRKDAATLHMVPHWTWPGREGEVTPVYCYTSYPEAELFVNGKSQGRKTFNKNSRLDRYRLRWNDVVYKPGELTVVAYDAKGRAADTLTVKTAGVPDHLLLTADRTEISSQGHDLAFVTVTMVDKNGNPCLEADNQLTFNVTGAGKFRAVCNGDATSLVTFDSRQMPLFKGRLVVIVEGCEPGTALLTVSAEGLPDTLLPISVK